MKKNLNKLFQYIIAILLFAGSIPLRADNNVLDRTFKLAQHKGTVYELLQEVSSVSGYLFVYDSQLVNNNRKVKIPDREYSLRKLIHAITQNQDLEIKIIGNHILLYLPKKNELPETKTPNTIDRFLRISGTVKNQITKEAVCFASVSIENSSIGTITNGEGFFKLLIPDSLTANTLILSQSGYRSQAISVQLLKDNNIEIYLHPNIIPLQEVVVRVGDPVYVLKNMLLQRSLNYNTSPVNMISFYREGTLFKNKNLGITEAVLNIYKQSITNRNDQVKLLKKRRIIDQQATDTLLPKMKSGINACLMLDVIKSDMPDFLIDIESNAYNYTHEDLVTIGDRQANVVGFEPKKGSDAFYCGRLYVDTEDNALLKLEIEVHSNQLKYATKVFVVKNAPKYTILVQNVGYSVSYRKINGIYYINHVRGDLVFKVKKKRQFFNSPLHIWFEMVNCETILKGAEPFPRNERISTDNIFTDIQFNSDDNFWGNFNTIIPEKELKESIIKILAKEQATSRK